MRCDQTWRNILSFKHEREARRLDSPILEVVAKRLDRRGVNVPGQHPIAQSLVYLRDYGVIGDLVRLKWRGGLLVFPFAVVVPRVWWNMLIRP